MANRNRYSVQYAPAGSDTYEDVSDCIDISHTAAIKATVDTFEFRVQNKSGYANKFNVDDKIKLFFWSGDGARPATPVISGMISSVKLITNVDSETWLVSGENRLERLLHTLLPVQKQLKTPPEWIVDWITKVNGYALKSTEKKIKYVYNSLDQDGAAGTDTITKTKSDGSSFDAVTYFALMDKPVFEMIEDMSGTTYTKDSYPYVFYLDTDDYFHWIYRATTFESSVTNTDFIEYTVEKGIFDVINGVIMVGGVDFNGAIIKDYAVDFSAISKGIRWKFVVPEKDISEELKRSSNVTINNDYPYGKEADYTGGNTAFRTAVHNIIRDRASDIVRRKGKAQFKVGGNMHGTTTYAAGDYIRVNIDNVFTDSLGNAVDYKDLRLERIEHTFNARQGWITKLELVEDVIEAVG